MAVQTAFFNWQSWGVHPMNDNYNRCSTNLGLLRDYMTKKWPMANSGCMNVRGVAGPGSSWSDHAYGAAIDMRYLGKGTDGKTATLGRERLLAEVIPWLINNSKELGVQAIHDYVGNRIWRAWRPDIQHPAWKTQGGTGDFRPGNTWIHIATGPADWYNSTPIDNRFVAVWNPPASYDAWPLKKDKPTLNMGPSNPWPPVMYLQAVLKYEAKQDIVIDGYYGEQTKIAVSNLQQIFKLNGTTPVTVEGRTWGAVDFLAIYKPGSGGKK